MKHETKQRQTKTFRKFRNVQIGETFDFARPQFSGLAVGPWIKTGHRTYTRSEDDGVTFKVGTINAQVEPTREQKQRYTETLLGPNNDLAITVSGKHGSEPIVIGLSQDCARILLDAIDDGIDLGIKTFTDGATTGGPGAAMLWLHDQLNQRVVIR